MQCNTIEYNTIHYNTIEYNTLHYTTIQYNTQKPKKTINSRKQDTIHYTYHFEKQTWYITKYFKYSQMIL